MITDKLYQKDVYKRECESTVLEVIKGNDNDGSVLLVLDKTIFFPAGGGQPCDLGTINDIPVTDVFEKDNIIYHNLREELLSSGICKSDLKTIFKVGSSVHSVLDWNRRFNNMQRHCGEHILSGIFFEYCGGVNRGFHMGDDYMTIDIDVKDIAWEDALKIEFMTNQAIWANLQVTTRYFEKREDAECLPLRKALALDEDITIVCVGNETSPADCVACCGTHPSTSGQVGIVKILKLENYKGMTRVYFKAGQEAFLDYQCKNDIINKLSLKYSSDDADLIEKIKVQDEKNKVIRQELHNIKNAFITNTVNGIIQEYSNDEKAVSASLPVIIKEYPYFNVNDLLNISKILMDSLKNLMVLVSTSEKTIIVAASGKYDCGKLVKDNAGVWGGKGGGNPNSARAMFQSMDDLNCFVTFIKQAY